MTLTLVVGGIFGLLMLGALWPASQAEDDRATAWDDGFRLGRCTAILQFINRTDAIFCPVDPAAAFLAFDRNPYAEGWP